MLADPAEYTDHMAGRLSQVTGIFTALVAGAALGILAIPALGVFPTLFLFLALTLAASVTQRAISRER